MSQISKKKILLLPTLQDNNIIQKKKTNKKQQTNEKIRIREVKNVNVTKKINKKSLKKSTKSYHNCMTVHALT